ncbi:MAG: site-specific DNA-methyltransferase [Deltaproteobacteria bacterium]|nr:site-specific DNA-methyltransferase [Deltaproteobacteria bacterium]
MSAPREQLPLFAAVPAAPVRLLHGDCLQLLAAWDEAADGRATLIYLDPPFMTCRDFGTFSDVWCWDGEAELGLAELEQGPAAGARRAAAFLRGLLVWAGRGPLAAFLVYLARRLAMAVERALHPATGSLVLHCDPSTSHYSKLLLDALLGPGCFLNEIIWHYRRWPVRSRFLQRMHDVLLFFRASAVSALDAERPFATVLVERAPSTLRRWGSARIHARRDLDGRRLPSREEEEDSAGAPLDDVWDLPIIAPSARERVGFPTQKPLALLERLISITTRPGDLVLDPCCGSGSTLVAAARQGRRAIGMDISGEALTLARQRLSEAGP